MRANVTTVSSDAADIRYSRPELNRRAAMKFDQIRYYCPECGSLTVTVFSARLSTNQLVARNRCPVGHYDQEEVVDNEALSESSEASIAH